MTLSDGVVFVHHMMFVSELVSEPVKVNNCYRNGKVLCVCFLLQIIEILEVKKRCAGVGLFGFQKGDEFYRGIYNLGNIQTEGVRELVCLAFRGRSNNIVD